MRIKPPLRGHWRSGRVKDFSVRLPTALNPHSTSGHAGRSLTPRRHRRVSRRRGILKDFHLG
jgi:hypothetical protein